MHSRSITRSWTRQTCYLLKMVLKDLIKKKYATLFTVLAIASSLTLPSVSYLLWKNIYLAKIQFYPKTELTIYLHKNLSESDSHLIVDKIRKQEGIEDLKYISRQESLEEFKHWSGFGEHLDILDGNPLPAIIIIKLADTYNEREKINELQKQLIKIKGIEDIQLDNNTLEKLTALSWLVAHIALICTILMIISVCLVIGNSIRSDVYSQRYSIDIMKLLGATEQFIIQPFIYTGIIYAVLGGFIASIFSAVITNYLANSIQYITTIFSINFELQGIEFSELLCLLIICAFIGYISAWFSAKKYS
ncbi:permease-like cell division protein FtsX [Avibacterium paragallinarum]|uniref:permease-like cell division protein FtsX n=1 Tax=Avibacterium paragallinarum TaxID=728 RepID=UPI00398881E6